MLFTSQVFLLFFLPTVAIIYLALFTRVSIRSSLWFLSIASVFFYGWWNPVYVLLIAFSIFYNYSFGLLLHKVNKHRYLIVFIAVAGNLFLLGYFKYAEFFVNNVNDLIDGNYRVDEIILPLAISFFTFQQISYIVDAYKNQEVHYKFPDYLLFVTFFPQLIAGPIVRHDHIIRQFSNPYEGGEKSSWIAKGLILLTLGLTKKVVFAEKLEEIANPFYDSISGSSALTLVDSWNAALAFSLQIYFDFSAYSDMAIGLALIFGFNLPINFNIPYKAKNIQDFWRRWHISLSLFLRDYLYIPLGGNRKGLSVQVLALATTMLLGGLWHGASWSFVIWGGAHGLALVLHLFWMKANLRMPGFISWPMLFIFLVFTWVLFRISDIDLALSVIKSMIDLSESNIGEISNFEWEAILVGILIATLGPSSTELMHKINSGQRYIAVIIGLLLVYFVVVGGYAAKEFIYFQF
jgi:alginate O-acetyltransferase complex protein AlgI